MVARRELAIVGGYYAIATRSPSISRMATGRIAAVAPVQASPSAGMRVPPGHSQSRVLTGTMAGRLPLTLPILKCGMPQLLPVHGKPTASTTHKLLLSARWMARHGNHSRAGCHSPSSICRTRCSPIPRLLARCTLASPMGRCGIRPITATPGTNYH